MTKDLKLILVGVISSAHGIKGDIIVKSYTNPIENILDLKLFDDKNVNLPIKKVRITPKGLICRYNHCQDRNQAETLIGTKLYCLRDDLPKTSEEEFYFEDLKNLSVLTPSGKKIGAISEVFNFGAGDLIEVEFSNGSGAEIYPFTKEFFPEVTKNHVVLANTKLQLK